MYLISGFGLGSGLTAAAAAVAMWLAALAAEPRAASDEMWRSMAMARESSERLSDPSVRPSAA